MRTALGALERLGAASDGDVVAALTDADPGVRRGPTIAARHPGVDLTIALADPDSTVVEVAAWACGERSEVADGVLHLLISLATDGSTDPLARESSVAASGAIGDERALDAILAAMATSRRSAVAVLALALFLDPGHARAGEIDAAPATGPDRPRLAGAPSRRGPPPATEDLLELEPIDVGVALDEAHTHVEAVGGVSLRPRREVDLLGAPPAGSSRAARLSASPTPRPRAARRRRRRRSTPSRTSAAGTSPA